ncbi:unnamed protein product [Arabis nemorensis]|uniref:Uncharacterized protein n=1 Tax=Arabis nemorensis TaxID=586526 RepID=A0A565BFN2_9BRAS|nr:unnamed protein product [Arabis nemorensis]
MSGKIEIASSSSSLGQIFLLVLLVGVSQNLKPYVKPRLRGTIESTIRRFFCSYFLSERRLFSPV